MTELKHHFAPQGAALQAFRSRDPEVLLAGPAGTGKSRACLEKLHYMCLLNPNLRCLILRATAVSLATSAVKTYERDVAVEAMQDGTVTFYGGGPRDPAQYRYDNGATISLGGMDKPSRIMSTEYDVIYVQELTELTKAGYEAATSRLRNGVSSFSQLLADCNPDHPTHWVNQRALAGLINMLNSRHQDNPLYFNADGSMTPAGEQYMARLERLTGVRRERLLKGLWAASEGVIFDGFDPGLHVIEEMPPGWEHWPTDWTVDFGFTHPFVWQEWVVDPDGRGILMQEIYKTKTLVEDHAKEILRLTLGRPRPRKIICDHDAEDRATLEKHTGYSTTAADKRVSVGLQATQSRFKLAGDGRPRLSILRGATVHRDPALVEAERPASTAEEIPGYIWNEAKDAPVKDLDDGCDAMRYWVADQDLRGETKVRVYTGSRRRR